MDFTYIREIKDRCSVFNICGKFARLLYKSIQICKEVIGIYTGVMDKENTLMTEPEHLQAEHSGFKNDIQCLVVGCDESHQMPLLLKRDLKRVKLCLKLRDREFFKDEQWNDGTISSRKAEISPTKEVQSDQPDTIQNAIHQKKDNITTSREAERQSYEKLNENIHYKVSNIQSTLLQTQQKDENVQLKGDYQDTVLLTDKWQMKVNQLTLQLHKKDKELLNVRGENSRLSRSLQEMTENLQNYRTEFLQTENSWQSKCNDLQEKLREELAQKEKMEESLEGERKKVSDQNNDNIQLHGDGQNVVLLQNEHQMKVKQFNQQLREKEEELQNLREENDRLSHRLKDRIQNLQGQHAEFLQSEEDWKLKYSDLQAKIREGVAKKEKMVMSLEIERQKISEHNDENAKLKEDNQKVFLLQDELQMKMNQYNQQLCEKEEELLNLKKNIDHLTGSLQEAKANLQSHEAKFFQNEENWQVKYRKLQEKFREELAEKKKMEANLEAERQKISEHNTEKVKLKEDNQKTVLLKNKLQLKVNQFNQQLREKEEELLNLKQDNSRLSLSLRETSENLQSYKTEFVQSEKNWQLKYKDLQESLREELAAREKSSVNLEAEKGKVSDQHDDNHKNALLQNELQMKVNQYKQELQEKDEELLNLRKDNDSLSQSLHEATEHLDSHKTLFLRNEDSWHSKFRELQEKLEKAVAGKKKIAVTLEAERKKVSEQNNEKIQLKEDNQKITLLQNDLQMKVKWYSQQLREKDEELLHIREDNQRLSWRLQETTENMQSQEVKFLESKDNWQLKYNELQEKLIQELAEKDKMATSLEAERQKVSEHNDMNVKLKADNQKTAMLKNDLQIKVNQCTWHLQQKEKELKTLRDENDHLAQSLQELLENLQSYETEFLQSEENWQLKFDDLQEKLREELAEKEKMAASLEAERQKVAEQNDENIQLKVDNQKNVLLQNELQIKVNQYDQQLCEKEEELLNLREDNDRLSCSLQETIENLQTHETKFLLSEGNWQLKYNDLQEKLRDELTMREEIWDTRVRQLQEELTKKEEEQEQSQRREHADQDLLNQRLTTLTDQKRVIDKLLESNKAWQEIYDALHQKFREELKEHNCETAVKELEEEEEEEKSLKEKPVQKIQGEEKVRQKLQLEEELNKKRNEPKELKKKEKEEKKQLEQKEKEMKAAKKKKEKEEQRKFKEEKKKLKQRESTARAKIK